MEKYSALGKDIFFNPINGEFSSFYGYSIFYATKRLMHIREEGKRNPRKATMNNIQSSMVIAEELAYRALKIPSELGSFCIEKRNRSKGNTELSTYADEHTELPFSKAKRSFDQIRKRY